MQISIDAGIWPTGAEVVPLDSEALVAKLCAAVTLSDSTLMLLKSRDENVSLVQELDAAVTPDRDNIDIEVHAMERRIMLTDSMRWQCLRGSNPLVWRRTMDRRTADQNLQKRSPHVTRYVGCQLQTDL